MKPGFREQDNRRQKKLVPSKFRKAIIEDVNLQQWTADVRVVGNTQAFIENVPLSSSISRNIKPGDNCILDIFDENNPRDCIVAYTYRRNFVRTMPGTGIATASSPATIPHHLTVLPSFVSVYMTQDPTTSVGSPAKSISNQIWFTQAPDATNIYVESEANNNTSSINVRFFTISM